MLHWDKDNGSVIFTPPMNIIALLSLVGGGVCRKVRVLSRAEVMKMTAFC
ncbi:hypothetical protein HanIR_Chr13g0633491 [Helianthus annuus]|nr:hypothetical protein HanIR_Chr13g0633491 [Helianthus annuus]